MHHVNQRGRGAVATRASSSSPYERALASSLCLSGREEGRINQFLSSLQEINRREASQYVGGVPTRVDSRVNLPFSGPISVPNGRIPLLTVNGQSVSSYVVATAELSRAWLIDSPIHERTEFARLVSLDGEKGNVKTLFHGTGVDNIANIVLCNLRVKGVRRDWRPSFARNTNMFGDGIYLTPDMDKALKFSYGISINRMESISGKNLWDASGLDMTTYAAKKFVIVVKAALGRCKLMEKGAPSLDETAMAVEGYDSVEGRKGYTETKYGGKLLHTEYVVYNSKRVVPVCLLMYSPVERKRVG